VAESLLQGWDDEDEQVVDVPQPTLSEAEPEEQPEEEVEAGPEPDEGEETPQPAEPEEGEEQAGEDEDEGDAAEEEEGVEALALDGFDVSDVEILAYLAQYQNDPVKALRAAAELRRAFGRQGTDLAAVRQRNQALEQQMVQARMLSGGVALSQEQHEWAEGAAATPNPGSYIEQALGAGQFDLARAVCTYWAREDPFNAGRAGQWIDSVEYQSSVPQPVEAPTEEIVDALKAKVPGFAEWEPQMVAVFQNLGPTHHLVQEAQSANVDVSMRALLSIFEIAQASSASVEERRGEIKKRARAESTSAKAAAAVTSSANAPSTPSETSRDVEIMPGLTLGDLETEFAKS
jgi:hypothetical protein